MRTIPTKKIAAWLEAEVFPRETLAAYGSALGETPIAKIMLTEYYRMVRSAFGSRFDLGRERQRERDCLAFLEDLGNIGHRLSGDWRLTQKVSYAVSGCPTVGGLIARESGWLTSSFEEVAF